MEWCLFHIFFLWLERLYSSIIFTINEIIAAVSIEITNAIAYVTRAILIPFEFMMYLLMANNGQHLTCFDKIALPDQDVFDDPCNTAIYWCFHFHRFHYQD